MIPLSVSREGPDGTARSPDLTVDGGVRAAWRTHSEELYGFALRALGDRGAADDAVQETFVRAWRASATYDPYRPLRPWLFAILRNVVIDEVRARKRRAVPSEDRETDPESAAVGVEQQIVDELLVHEALLRIRTDQRVILVETYYRGRRYADVARELGIPEGTARTRAFYGLQALRLALQEMGWDL